MTNLTRAFAPFTEAEVESLNGFQKCGYWHEFTCISGHGALVATTAGFSCPHCEYRQNWAWLYMMNGEWRSP